MIFVRDIQRIVAASFGLSAEDLREDDGAWGSRQFERSHPRQYAMLLARELTTTSYVRIGHLFNRDHSTVISGIRSARKRVSADRNLALKLEAIALLLTSEPPKVFEGQVIGFPPRQELMREAA